MCALSSSVKICKKANLITVNLKRCGESNRISNKNNIINFLIHHNTYSSTWHVSSALLPVVVKLTPTGWYLSKRVLLL